MFKPTTPAPQKKSDFGATQQKPLEKEVMEAVKRKGKPTQPKEVEKSKTELLNVIRQQNLDPQAIIRAGKMAEAALKNPREMYQVAVDNAIKQGLIRPQDVQPGVIDWKILGIGLTAGKLTEQLIQEGKL